MNIISPELKAFFESELRNQHNMEEEASQKGYGYPLPATLGTALDSLTQAPPDVIESWFIPFGENYERDQYLHAWDIITALIEFLQLLNNEGRDFLLEDVEYVK